VAWHPLSNGSCIDFLMLDAFQVRVPYAQPAKCCVDYSTKPTRRDHGRQRFGQKDLFSLAFGHTVAKGSCSTAEASESTLAVLSKQMERHPKSIHPIEGSATDNRLDQNRPRRTPAHCRYDHESRLLRLLMSAGRHRAVPGSATRQSPRKRPPRSRTTIRGCQRTPE